jgi:hypothetical protein
LIPLCFYGVSNPPGRESVAPFINGDTFRAYCNHAFDELSSLVARDVRDGDTIFINGDFAELFFTSIHPRIHSRYILICHNTDHSFPGQFVSILNDQKLIALFTQNLDGTQHPKLYPLPIGIRNRHWEPQNREIIQKYKSLSGPKTHLAYCNITAQTYPSERNQVLDICLKSSYCYCSQWKDFETYAREVSESKFTIAPRGNGLDTHRLWEALYLGSIPVVKTSSLDPLFEGLPVLIINDWSELTEEFLHQKYAEITNSRHLMSKLYAEYYFDQIEMIRSINLFRI